MVRIIAVKHGVQGKIQGGMIKFTVYALKCCCGRIETGRLAV